MSGEDFENSKPDPAIFVHAAWLAQTPVTECIVIEDSANGVAAAKAAGDLLHWLRQPPLGRAAPDLADRVISSFSELSAPVIEAIEPG